jgi:hypothetical protein
MPVQTDWSRRAAVADWLSANGIDPNTVPLDGDLLVEDAEDGRVIRCETFVHSETGAKVMDPRGVEAREVRIVPLAVEPPEWWTPYEKPTREQLLAAVDRVRALCEELKPNTEFVPIEVIEHALTGDRTKEQPGA